MRLPFAALWLGLVASIPVGCGDASFACTSDMQCETLDGGRCEPTGYCSFVDETCESGRRYGSLAGGDRGGACVDPPGATDGTAGTSSATSNSTTSAGSDSTTSSGSASTTSAGSSVTAVSATDTGEPFCGDDIVEPGEDCEPSRGVDATCGSLGFDGGTLACGTDCLFDTSACTQCGNLVIENGEVCDAAPPGELDCTTEGFFGGQLGCFADCTLDVSQCHNCGNGSVDAGELCEAGQDTAFTCSQVGYGGEVGALACAGDCRSVDTSACGLLACGVDASGINPGECPPICTSCDAGVCLIDCGGSSTCSDANIVCPAGFDCTLQCNGTSSCNGAAVQCPPHTACSVSCSGTNACNGLDLQCSTDGSCHVSCVTGNNVCQSTAVTCGLDACTASCGPGTGGPNVACGDSCDCQPCG